MTTEAGKNGLAVANTPEWNFTDAEKAAIRAVYAKEATEEQFTIFWAEAMRRKLMPGRQLFFRLQRQKEWNPTTRTKEWTSKPIHITGIDAFRLIAQRTGKYAGQQPVIWIYAESNRAGETSFRESLVPIKGLEPYAARVTVLRHDFKEPLATIARWDAYVQTFENDKGDRVPNTMWARMGPEQLAKCAEALALRKAFPEDLWGLYIQEEFPDNPEDSSPTPTGAAAASPQVAAAPAPVSAAPAAVVEPKVVDPNPVSVTEMENHSATPVTQPPSTQPVDTPGLFGSGQAPKATAQPAAKKVDRPDGKEGAKWYIRNVLDKEKVKGGGDLMKAYILRAAGATDIKAVTETQWASALAVLDTVFTSAGAKKVIEVIQGQKAA